mgnify:CR=1 FL=1
MGGLTTPEGNTGALEAPLTLQVTKEAKIMISKLKELKLDEVSAPGMAVLGLQQQLQVHPGFRA